MNKDDKKTEKKKLYVVGVITARGGSKGLPRKNILPLNGKPVIAYTIEAALKSGVMDKVIVSTDDKEIAEISKRYGAEVPFMRPAELATDTAHSIDVIEHAVNFIEQKEGKKADAVFTLQPTSPLRTAEHLKMAYKKFLESDVDCVVSVKKAYPPWWMLKKIGSDKNGKDIYGPFAELGNGANAHNLERQQLPPVYELNGAVYITRGDYMKKAHNVTNPHNCSIIEMSDEESYDIDSEVDLLVIERIIKKRE